MAVKKTKTLRDVNSVTTVNSSQMIPLTDSNGAVTKISLANLKAALLGETNLDAIQDGVFVMFHRKSDNYPLMVKPHKWTGYQNGGEIAEGVVIVEGGKMLVVAPTESSTTLHWASANISGGGKTTSDRVTAFNDWAGKENTAAQIQHPECSSASYAPSYCAAYSKTNANGKGLTAGRWWLPSMGEMMMIYANMTKINAALDLINGAEPLVETAYWTSTEYSSASAWILTLDYGNAYNYSYKATYSNRVRAVSAFLY